MDVVAPEIVARVVDALLAREDELVGRMLERFAAEAPETGIGVDPDITEAMRSSSVGNLRAALDHILHGGDPLPSGPPVEAIEEARIAAQAGMPLAPGIQTYRVGQAVVWDAMLGELEELEPLGPSERTALLRLCTQRSFAYIDAVIPFVMDEYTRERDRLLRGREQRRVQLVRDVLDGAEVDGGELGYELRDEHRAVVARGPGAEAELARIAAALGARVLVVAVTGTTSWGWLAAGASADDRAVRGAVEDWPGTLAFGRPGAGPEGFRGSHREARSADRLGVAAADAVTFFDDVALESVLLADEEGARAFVAAELAPLDAARDGAKLRETLSAYFACGFNASAAAAALGVGDRTVAYRLRNIEEALGRPVRTRQTELQAAIRLERVLGA